MIVSRPELRILGLGHIGASLAARATSKGYRVSGWDRDTSAVRLCRRRGWIVDELEARLCVVAVPEGAVQSAELVEALEGLRPGSVVTDVFSSKGEATHALARICRGLGLHFAWSHPLAGREVRGARSAEPKIFESAVVLVDASGDRVARETAERFWRTLGCRVERQSTARHQKELARGSHLAHVIAFAFSRVVKKGGRATPSVLSATRVAKSDPKAWAEIWASNRSEVIKAIRLFEDELKRIRHAVEKSR